MRMFVKGSEPTTIADALNNYDHVGRLIGPEQLGGGREIHLEGYDALPADPIKALQANYKASYGFRTKIETEGVDDPKRTFERTEGLIRRRYTDTQIEGILGGKFRRVLGEVWRGAS